MSDLTAEQKLCTKRVPDHTGFHWFSCGKPAKFLVAGTNWYRCGIHARRHRNNGQKLEPIK